MCHSKPLKEVCHRSAGVFACEEEILTRPECSRNYIRNEHLIESESNMFCMKEAVLNI